MSAPLPDADADVSPVRLTAALESRTQKTRARATTVRENRVWVRVGCAGRSRLRARVGTHRAAVRAAGGDVRVERRDASGRRVGHDSCGSWEGEARRFVTTERIDRQQISNQTRACQVFGCWNAGLFGTPDNLPIEETAYFSSIVSYELRASTSITIWPTRAALLRRSITVVQSPEQEARIVRSERPAFSRHRRSSRTRFPGRRSPAARHAAAAAVPRRAASNCSVTRSCFIITRASARVRVRGARTPRAPGTRGSRLRTPRRDWSRPAHPGKRFFSRRFVVVARVSRQRRAAAAAARAVPINRAARLFSDRPGNLRDGSRRGCANKALGVVVVRPAVKQAARAFGLVHGVAQGLLDGVRLAVLGFVPGAADTNAWHASSSALAPAKDRDGGEAARSVASGCALVRAERARTPPPRRRASARPLLHQLERSRPRDQARGAQGDSSFLFSLRRLRRARREVRSRLRL